MSPVQDLVTPAEKLTMLLYSLGTYGSALFTNKMYTDRGLVAPSEEYVRNIFTSAEHRSFDSDLLVPIIQASAHCCWGHITSTECRHSTPGPQWPLKQPGFSPATLKKSSEHLLWPAPLWTHYLLNMPYNLQHTRRGKSQGEIDASLLCVYEGHRSAILCR